MRLDRSLPNRFGAYAGAARCIVDALSDCVQAAAARLDAAVRLGDAEPGDAFLRVLLDLRGRP